MEVGQVTIGENAGASLRKPQGQGTRRESRHNETKNKKLKGKGNVTKGFLPETKGGSGGIGD